MLILRLITEVVGDYQMPSWDRTESLARLIFAMANAILTYQVITKAPVRLREPKSQLPQRLRLLETF